MTPEQIAVDYFLTVSYMKKYRAQYEELLCMKLPGKRELSTIAEIIDEIALESEHGIPPLQWEGDESWREFMVKNLEDIAKSETPEAQELFQRFITIAKAYSDLRKRRGILRRSLYWAGRRLNKEE